MIGKVLDHQVKQVTYNVYSFFKKRKADPNTMEYRTDINLIDTVADATGLSKSTVTRIIREGNTMKVKTGNIDFRPHDKKKHVRKKRIEVDEMMEGVIRRKVIQFYSIKNEVPSVRRLNALLKEEKILNCSNEYLRQMLHKLGFTNTESDTSGMMREREDIVAERLKYLQAMKQFREKGKSIFFFSYTKQWAQENVAKPAEMPQIVVVHAFGEAGFLDGALLMMKMKPKSANDSTAEDIDIYKWVKGKMIPNVPPHSVLVLNSADLGANTAVSCDKLSSGATRATLQDWLKRHNIPFKETDAKSDLLDLIKVHQIKAEHNIVPLFKDRGLEVLHLPQNHSDLNPAAIVWEEIKDGLDAGSPKALISKYPKDKWETSFEQVKQNECEYYEHDVKIDDKDHLKQLKKVKEEPEEEETNTENDLSMDCDF